mmetsp:Transcript_60384/g.135995  ORF Transcript_60384/g.135995 Transcript_60384/m.135995 type:complete len:517 (-) Transcript_60384:161-1711(-)
MIHYDSSGNHLKTVLQFRGSVVPPALTFAFPCGILGVLLCLVKHESAFFNDIFPSESSDVGSFIGFNTVLGFLLVFRAQNGYARYWEGATLMQRVRGVWFNSASHLFAFCSPDPEKAQAVAQAQHAIVKLMSLLYCTSLQSVAVTANKNFEVLDTDGLDLGQLRYMAMSHDPPAVLMHWMQRMIVKLMREELIDIPPAVLSRVFQELSNGVVALTDATKISDMPFPFAFAQMISVMLLIQFILAPILCAAMTDSILLAGVGSFLAVFFSCSLNLIASEIELPFGDDANDLPLNEMQQSMNVSLLTLIHWRTQKLPIAKQKKKVHTLRLALYEECFDESTGIMEGGEANAIAETVLQTPTQGKLISGTNTNSARSVLTVANQRSKSAKVGGYASESSDERSIGRRRTKHEYMRLKWQGRTGANSHPIQFLQGSMSVASTSPDEDPFEAMGSLNDQPSESEGTQLQQPATAQNKDDKLRETQPVHSGSLLEQAPLRESIRHPPLPLGEGGKKQRSQRL